MLSPRPEVVAYRLKDRKDSEESDLEGDWAVSLLREAALDRVYDLVSHHLA